MTKDCSFNYKFSAWEFQAQNMGRTCFVHELFWMSKQKRNNLCTQHDLPMFWAWNFHALNLQFNEQYVVILWVSWCKNKSFWQRFTCTLIIWNKSKLAIGTFNTSPLFHRNISKDLRDSKKDQKYWKPHVLLWMFHSELLHLIWVLGLNTQFLEKSSEDFIMQESNQISEGMLVMLHVISKYSLNMSNLILICNQKKCHNNDSFQTFFFSRFLQPNCLFYSCMWM